MTEKFVDSYHRCKCCTMKVHLYFFPLDRKTGVRAFGTCVSCIAQCGETRKCKLGMLHG